MLVQPADAPDEAGRAARVAAYGARVQDLDRGRAWRRRRGAPGRRARPRPRAARARASSSRLSRRRSTRVGAPRRPRSRRTPSRRRPARPPSWSGRRRCRRGRSATRTWAVKVFMWSGPSSSMTYSGTPRPCSAASSWREVFQSRPAPSADAASMSGSKSRCTTSAEVSMPPLRCTAPITASTVSERIEALSRPPVDSSPRPSLTCSPSPIVAADLGQRAGVDDRGAQLGQPALGEVGVGDGRGSR